MSRRLQITLSERQYAILNDEANRTSVSMAELIRRLVDRALRPDARPQVAGFEVSLGLWKLPDAAVVGRRPGPELRD
jgi:hypothetical protein